MIYITHISYIYGTALLVLTRDFQTAPARCVHKSGAAAGLGFVQGVLKDLMPRLFASLVVVPALLDKIVATVLRLSMHPACLLQETSGLISSGVLSRVGRRTLTSGLISIAEKLNSGCLGMPPATAVQSDLGAGIGSAVVRCFTTELACAETA